MQRLLARNFSSNAKRNVVIVDGCRIPFTLAGTAYKNLMAVDLGRLAIKGLLTKTAIDPKMVHILSYYKLLYLY
jgi:acetyl-CoA acetyltransferase